jgi:hypothetical protein
MKRPTDLRGMGRVRPQHRQPKKPRRDIDDTPMWAVCVTLLLLGFVFLVALLSALRDLDTY